MKPPEDIQLPSHAYVPGENDRHAEDAFDAIHASVSEGMDTEALASTTAWRAGWLYVRHGYFWEAHEVLEPVWMALPDGSPEKEFVQGVIQTANAALKARMRRPNAVRRLCSIARGHLDAAGDVPVMGLDPDEVRHYLAGLEAGDSR